MSHETCQAPMQPRSPESSTSHQPRCRGCRRQVLLTPTLLQSPPRFKLLFFLIIIKKKAKHHLATSLPTPAPCWSKRRAGAPYEGSVLLRGDQKPALVRRAQTVGWVRMCLGQSLKAAASCAARSLDGTRHPSKKRSASSTFPQHSIPKKQCIPSPFLGEKSMVLVNIDLARRDGLREGSSRQALKRT